MRITGQLIGLFSFDIGYEIEIDRARTLAEPAEALEVTIILLITVEIVLFLAGWRVTP